MEKKKIEIPAIVWLKVTDYMHGWLQYELTGSLRIGDQRIVCIQHLPGAREAFRMQTDEDVYEITKVDKTMSCTRMNCIKAGMVIDEKCIERLYGVTRQSLRLFVPLECPKMCLKESGILRPWTFDTCLEKQQAIAMQRVVRNAFWQAVETFNEGYARKMNGAKYPTIDMVEAFCRETETPDSYAEDIKREWNRRVKRK